MKVTVITGQTATGKTRLALNISSKNNKSSIINIDSRQIYKKLDIITGKDIKSGSAFNLIEKYDGFDIGFYNLEQQKVWLYDVVNPDRYFSAYDWEKVFLHLFQYLKRQGVNQIVIIGGTYFYIHYLLYQREGKNIKINWEWRKRMEKKELKEIIKKIIDINKSFYLSLSESKK